jgi:hypothetical protein
VLLTREEDNGEIINALRYELFQYVMYVTRTPNGMQVVPFQIFGRLQVFT